MRLTTLSVPLHLCAATGTGNIEELWDSRLLSGASGVCLRSDASATGGVDRAVASSRGSSSRPRPATTTSRSTSRRVS